MSTRAKVVAFLQENEKDFRQGNEFTDEAINKAFGIKAPVLGKLNKSAAMKAVMAYQNKKVAVQVAINKVLAPFGLYMSQKQLTNYRIRDKKETQNKVKALRASGNRKIRFAATLQTGLTVNGGVLRLEK